MRSYKFNDIQAVAVRDKVEVAVTQIDCYQLAMVAEAYTLVQAQTIDHTVRRREAVVVLHGI